MYSGRIFLTLILIVIRRGFYLNSQMEKRALLAQPPEVTSIEEIKLSARPLISEIQKFSGRVKQVVQTVPHQEVRNDRVYDLLYGSFRIVVISLLAQEQII